MKKTLLICALVLTFGLATVSAGYAENIAAVDVTNIITNSKPGKAGEAHLKKVQDVLQKGLNDLQKMYKGKEKTAEAQGAIRDGYVALERQMAAEKQAVLQVLGVALEKAVKEWRADNKKYTAVMNKQMFLDSDASMDVTADVMKEMDKQQVKFPDLPTVSVNEPKKDKPAQNEKKKK